MNKISIDHIKERFLTLYIRYSKSVKSGIS